MFSARNGSSADLARKLRTADAIESASLLESLILDIAAPLVRRTVKRRFSSARNTRPEDLEDVCADAISAVIVCLRRHNEGGPEIDDFEHYAATVASNTADRFFAARAPQRARLRNRIRYVLTTNTRFTIRECDSGVWACAFRNKPQAAPLSGGDVEACRHKLAAAKLSTHKLPELIREILTAAAGPLELSDLTTFAAHAMGITDHTESVDDHTETLRDPAVPFAHSAERKDWLIRLWAEVCQLPLSQRIALLLNLGSADSAGNGTTLCAIADLGVATFAALAEALEMTPLELAEIWNRVPLGDKEIALRLHLERQQIINLRASARQRLVRRMAAIDKAALHTNTGENPDTRGLSR